MGTTLTGILVGSLEARLSTAIYLGRVGQHIRYFDRMGGYQTLECIDRIVRCCRAPIFKKGYICIIAHRALRYLAATPLGKFLALNSTPLTPLISAFTFATASIPPFFPVFPPGYMGFACGSFSRYARSSLMLSRSGFVGSPSGGRRSESLLWIPTSALVWSWVGEKASSSGPDEVEASDGEGRGDVCVPAERRKKRAPSELVESPSESSSSSSWEWGGGVSGTCETALASFSFNVSVCAPALSKSEWRADVRFATMGSTMYLLVP